MIEISKIFLIFPIYLLFICAPLQIYDKVNNKLNINFLSFNLIINCNILLLLSLTNFKIQDYQLFLFIIYVLVFLFNTIKSKENFLKIKTNIFILFVSFIIFGLVIANNLDLGWDAKYFYHTKTLFFYEGLGLKELSEFEHNKWHPHFGSFLWAFFWSIPIFDIEYFGRLFYLFIFCFSIYFITVESNKNTLFNFVLFFLITLITFNYERFSGLQEILIFSFLIISSKVLYDLKISNKIFSVTSILLIVNLLLWIKSEGIAYAIFLIIILTINKNIFLKEKIIIFTIFISLILFKNFIFGYYEFELNSQPYNLAFIKLINFNELLFRIKSLIIYGGYYTFKNILLLISSIVLIKLYFEDNNQIKLLNFFTYFILNILFIFFAYILRDMEIIYSLKTTLERIVFTSSAFYIYLIVLFVNKKIKIN